MKKINLYISRRLLFILPLIIIILTLACGSPTKLVTINLNQEELNKIIQKTSNIASPDGWEFNVDNVEIKDGFIRINGIYNPQGGGLLPGSMDVTLVVDDDQLKGKIDKLRYQGFAVADQPLEIVSDMIVQQIVSGVSEGKKEVGIESVEAKDGLVKIIIRYLP